MTELSGTLNASTIFVSNRRARYPTKHLNFVTFSLAARGGFFFKKKSCSLFHSLFEAKYHFFEGYSIPVLIFRKEKVLN